MILYNKQLITEKKNICININVKISFQSTLKHLVIL